MIQVPVMMEETAEIKIGDEGKEEKGQSGANPLHQSSSMTLQTELSMMFANLERFRKLQSMESHKQSDVGGGMTLMERFIEKYLPLTKIENDFKSISRHSTLKPNLHFIWDTILDAIANHSSNKYPPQAFTSKKELQKLPPVLQLSQTLFNHCPEQSIEIILKEFMTSSDGASGAIAK